MWLLLILLFLQINTEPCVTEGIQRKIFAKSISEKNNLNVSLNLLEQSLPLELADNSADH